MNKKKKKKQLKYSNDLKKRNYEIIKFVYNQNNEYKIHIN